MDLFDRLGALIDLRPQAEALINLLRAERQGGGARVITGLITRTRRERLNQANAPTAQPSFGLQSHGQAGTDQAAADNRNIHSRHT